MMKSVFKTEFANNVMLAVALANDVAGALRTAVARDGNASLLLSGGSTPVLFLQHLSCQDLDWSSVRVTLVDERWVSPDADRSNARLVADNLLQGAAANAQFQPLYVDGKQADDAVADLEAVFAQWPTQKTVVILGMGTDGHTASFFPGGNNLARAVDPQTTRLVSSMRAGGAGEDRMTFTLPALLATDFLALHIEGEAKAKVLEKALADGPVADLPIRSVLRQDRTPLNIYWCP